MRTTRYHQIADELRESINSARLARGQRLPSESELMAQHGVSRVTVRRALEVLRAEGLVESRRGFGWMVTIAPFRTDLSTLSTIERHLIDAGAHSERRIIGFGFVPSPEPVRELLGDRTVLEVRRIHLADGEPFARVTVWCPETVGAHLSRDDVERASFLDQLPVEIGGATQTIGAGAASADDAELLNVPPQSPVLTVERVTSSVAGHPVLVSEHVFPAHRMQFVVELPADDGTLPAGLRLVADN